MTTVKESVTKLAQAMADGRTGKIGAPISLQDYHMAVLSHKHFGVATGTEVRTQGPIRLTPSVEEIEKNYMVEKMGLKALTLDGSTILMKAWAGSTIWRAIDEALEIRERTGKRVAFVFNDKLVEISEGVTKESAFDRWDRSTSR
jgi:hypothetical protein